MTREFKQTVSAYDVLGIPPNADQKQVHAAVRKLAMLWHPDRVPGDRRGEATLRFQTVMDAYAKIRTPDARANYNKTLPSITSTKTHIYKAAANTNNQATLPLSLRMRAWLRAFETVFWPVRR